MAEQVATYTCEACGTAFTDPDGGGTCILCLQPYCTEHLGKQPTADAPGPLCTTCAGSMGA